MQKLAMIIGAVLLLAGVATAGTFARLGASEDRPTITTEAPPAATQAGDVRREDRGADRPRTGGRTARPRPVATRSGCR
jgi:hypothetical protein